MSAEEFENEFFKSLAAVIESGEFAVTQARELTPKQKAIQDLETCRKLECAIKQRLQERYQEEGGIGHATLHDTTNMTYASQDFVEQLIKGETNE